MYQSEPQQEADGTLKMSNRGEFNDETNYKGESRVRETIKSTTPQDQQHQGSITVPRPEGHREGVISTIWKEKLQEEYDREDPGSSVKGKQPTRGHLL